MNFTREMMEKIVDAHNPMPDNFAKNIELANKLLTEQF